MKTCVCHIVPRYVKEILINDGLLDPTVAAETMDFDRFFRLQRSRKSYQLMAGVAAPGPSGTAARTVCDCRNTKKLHQNILRVEGHAPVLDPDANLAYDNVGIVRDYYKNVLKRDSLDDRGLDLELNIHYENGYDNAAWNGEVMVFGDGKKFFGHLVRGLDVIAHELTHGVVQYTAGFTDEEFPGTLNEHFADVMATVIKQYNRNENAQTGNWLIGEDIILPTFPGTALRSLKAPGTVFSGDPQPDNMANYLPWDDDPHINNGIPNKAFYLVAAGDATAQGIDTQLAGKLWYEALLIMKPRSNFKDLYKAVHKKAVELTGEHVLPSYTVDAVDNAFKTVGII